MFGCLCPRNRTSYLTGTITKVVMPQKVGNVYIYDEDTAATVPQGLSNPSQTDYDVPPSRYLPKDSSPTGTNKPMTGDKNQNQTNVPMQKTFGNKTLQREQPRLSSDMPFATYDTPQSLQKVTGGGGGNGHDYYDIPPSHNCIPASNRSSSVSMLSTGSNNTVSSSLSNPSLPPGSISSSMCGSARSSSELSGQDIYDHPPAAKSLSKLAGQASKNDNANQGGDYYDIPTKHMPVKTGMVAAALDIYDTPTKTLGSNRSSIDSTGKGMDFYDSPRAVMSVYDTPKSKSGQVVDAGDYEAIKEDSVVYDTPKSSSRKSSGSYDNHNQSRVSSGDSGIDTSTFTEAFYSEPGPATTSRFDDDVYDVPHSNAPTLQRKLDNSRLKNHIHLDPKMVYDTPSQVTRDSAISLRSDISSMIDDASSNCFSMCSAASSDSDLPPINYDELELDLDSALEELVRMQQDLGLTSSKVLNFVSNSWRTRKNLEPKVFDIKIACLKLRGSLEEIVKFGQGVCANSYKAADKKLTKKLLKPLDSLQESSQTIAKSVDSLDSQSWNITKLELPALDPRAEDHLGAIVSATKDIPNCLRTLSSLVQGNSTLLFKRGPKVDKEGKKPPVAPKPKPFVKPKPKWETGGRTNGIYQEITNIYQEVSEIVPQKEDKENQNTVNEETYENTESLKQAKEKLKKSNSRENMIDESNYVHKAKWMREHEYDYITVDEAKAKAPPTVSVTSPEKKETNFTTPTVSAENIYSNEVVNEGVENIYGNQTHADLTQNVVSGNAVQIQPMVYPDDICDYDNNVGIDENIAMQREIARSQENLLEEVYENAPQGGIANSQRLKGQMTRSQENLLEEVYENAPVVSLQAQEGKQTGLSPKFREMMERLQNDSTTGVVESLPPGVPSKSKAMPLHENDRQLLMFYDEQVKTHAGVLMNATETFFQSVNGNQQPKVFIAQSKFVILAAHKLVYIADTLNRNLISDDVRNKIMFCANHLCDCLKLTVTTTKTAALQFPVVTAVQEMVDCVVDVTQAVNNLGNSIAESITA